MTRLSPACSGLLLVLLAGPVALGDGFHSPLLTNKDPRRWALTERERLGLNETDSADEAGPGNRPAARGAAKRLVDVLKYLDRRNVLLREFPDFNYDHIPGFKTETESILIAIGKDAVPLLVETLVTDLIGSNVDPGGLQRAADFRKRVTRILVAIGEDSLETLFAHLRHPSGKVRSALLAVVEEIVGEPDFDNDLEAWFRWWAIHRAGRSKRAVAIPELLTALEDPDPRIRLAAVRALSAIGSGQAGPALREILSNAKEKVLVAEVLRALVRVGDFRSAPLMIELLDNPDPALRAEAVTALRFLTHEMFGYDPKATAADRAPAVERWRAWWRSR